MRTTGIVRGIDDLGRVIIPREIRKQIGIKDGDPLKFLLINRTKWLGSRNIKLTQWTKTKFCVSSVSCLSKTKPIFYIH